MKEEITCPRCDNKMVNMQACHMICKKCVLMTKGVGLNEAEKGERVRKLIRGNTISEEIYQINCKFDGEIPKEESQVEEASTSEESKDSEKKE